MVDSVVKTELEHNLSESHEENQNLKIVFPPLVFPRAQEKSWRKWNYVCKCKFNLRAFCRSYVPGKHNAEEEFKGQNDVD